MTWMVQTGGMQHKHRDQDWYLFSIPTKKLLNYIEQVTGKPFPAAPGSQMEAQRWHLALRKGLRSPLHLDVGIPGLYQPENPVVENESALHAALLLGMPSVQVILSGEWEEASRHGLITDDQLTCQESAIAVDMLEMAAPDSH